MQWIGRRYEPVHDASIIRSGIVLQVPNVINLCKNPADCEEGKGFAPDYWLDADTSEAAVAFWIKENFAKK